MCNATDLIMCAYFFMNFIKVLIKYCTFLVNKCKGKNKRSLNIKRRSIKWLHLQEQTV